MSATGRRGAGLVKGTAPRHRPVPGLDAARAGVAPGAHWNNSARFGLRLGVIGHAPHWVGTDGALWAYEPYVREMRVWAGLFGMVRICSPAAEGPMRGNLAPYECDNIEWRPVAYSLKPGWAGLARRVIQIPGLVAHAWRTIGETDFIQLRSPGHFGLIGSILTRALGRPSLTKWAGENGSYSGERLPSRFERWFQGIPSDRHHVLVYGPARRPHQIEFLPALMSSRELQDALRIGSPRVWPEPWTLLSVGRLEGVKGFDLAIRGLAQLLRDQPAIDWTYTLIGDGSIAGSLRKLARDEGLGDRIRFLGALPFADVQRYQAAAHVTIMPGTKEGWPKVIAEAWAHGAVPVAAKAGLVPAILGPADAGRVFEPSPMGLSRCLTDLFTHPEELRALSLAGPAKAANLSLEKFDERLRDVLVESCGLV